MSARSPRPRRSGLVASVALVCLAVCALAAPSARATYGDEFALAPAQGALPGATAFWASACDLAAAEAQAGTAPPSPRDCIDPGITNTALVESPLAWSSPPSWRLKAVTQAGAHPDATAIFAFSRDISNQSGLNVSGEVPFPAGTVRDLKVLLPPGVAGNPGAVAQCTNAQFESSPPACLPQSQVGVAEIRFDGPNFTIQRLPVYSLQALSGRTAEFGIPQAGYFTTIRIVASARTDGDFGLTTGVERIPTGSPLLQQSLTFWGVPWAASHDRWRLKAESPLLAGGEAPGLPEEGLEPADQAPYEPIWGPIEPFFSNPTSCDGSEPTTSFFADSWQNPAPTLADGEPDPSDSRWVKAASAAPPVTGCEKLAGHFDPGFTFQPQSHVADSPSAYDIDLSVPQNNQPPAGIAEDPSESGAPAYWRGAAGLATAHLRDTTVTLPRGIAVNPSSANGLAACSEAQIGLTSESPLHFDDEEPTCPDASKLGTFEVETPLLPETLQGTVYLAAQKANPFHSLLAIYLAIEDPERGLVVKLAGKTEPNPSTGQLTATFTENPQLPFEHFKLHFKGGPQAPLQTPATCGSYETATSLTPWSGQAAATPSSSFQITSGPNGSVCANSEAEEPNSPSFSAGTVNPVAGSYSPFVLKLSRKDGSQEIKGIDTTLPPGLTGKLAGVAECSDASIAAASQHSGVAEQASPSCPLSSEVGTVDVASGAGPTPLNVGVHAYLAGHYKGAPLSLAIVTPAVAGPFDLGTVVVRTALYVNPETAQIHAVSDEIPHILEGIPLDVRSIDLSLGRPDFTLNPTSCEEMVISGQATSTLSQIAPLTNRFQVGGCKGLDFKPKLALRVFGKTNRNAKPRFRAVLTTKPGEANIARAQVNLPHSEFLEQGHIKTICTGVQFNAGGGHGEQCPTGSIYGHARAFTPLLDRPLEGPVFLRSSSHKLPDLIAALNGQIDIALAGKVDSGPNAGIRNTFEVVPDAPVSKFILEMRGGKKGLLVNSENLCSKQAKTRALVRFTAQNGKVEAFKPQVANQCKKHKKGRRGKGNGKHQKRHQRRAQR